MSAENVEIVRRFFECWTNQDFDAALQCADARVSFDVSVASCQVKEASAR